MANIRHCLLVVLGVSLLGACAVPGPWELVPEPSGEGNYTYDVGALDNEKIDFKDTDGVTLRSIPSQTYVLYEGICKGIARLAKVDLDLKIRDSLVPNAGAGCSSGEQKRNEAGEKTLELARDYDQILSLSSHSAREIYEASITSVLNSDSEEPSENLRRAILAFRSGNDQNAREAVQEILEQNPRNQEALKLGATLSLINGDEAEAISSLRSMSDDSPQSLHAKRLLARSYIANGEWDLARKLLKSSIDESSRQLHRLGPAPDGVTEAHSTNLAGRTPRFTSSARPAWEVDTSNKNSKQYGDELKAVRSYLRADLFWMEELLRKLRANEGRPTFRDKVGAWNRRAFESNEVHWYGTIERVREVHIVLNADERKNENWPTIMDIKSWAVEGNQSVAAAMSGRTAQGLELPTGEGDAPTEAEEIDQGPCWVEVTFGLIDLIDNDPDEIAAMCAHEIAHIAAGHVQERKNRFGVIGSVVLGAELVGSVAAIAIGANPDIARLGVRGLTGIVGITGVALESSFSVGDEIEADKLSLGYIKATEYDANGPVDLLRKMNSDRTRSLLGANDATVFDDFFATHPLYEDRLELLQNANSP